MQIRRATTDDIDDICALDERSWDSEDRANDDIWLIHIESETVYCIEGDEGIIGVLLSIESGNTQDNSSEIHKLMIDPDYQGQGLGYMLMEECIGDLDTTLKNVFLRVSPDNTTALNLYESCGFKIIDDTQDMLLMQHSPT